MRRVYSCHLCWTHACSAVAIPQRIIHVGTHATMPYLLPRAAPTGCSDTKKAKKRATAVLRSPLSRPMSVVKCADSAFPIYTPKAVSSCLHVVTEHVGHTFALSSALKRKRSARNGRSRQSSFRSVRLCTRGSTRSTSSTSSGCIVGRGAGEGAATAESSNDCPTAMPSCAKLCGGELNHGSQG